MEIYPICLIEIINIVKCLYYPKQSTDLIQSHDIFHGSRTKNLKIIWNPKDLELPKQS